MFYDQMRRNTVLSRFGTTAVLISAMALVSGCETFRPIGDAVVGGLDTAGKVTVGGLNTAGRATVGGLQWVVDGGESGIRGQTHGATDQPFLLVTGLRFPGIRLSDISVRSIEAVDGKGSALTWKQGSLADTKDGPALTITVEPRATTRTVDVTGVLIYLNARWTLSARCVELPRASDESTDRLWRTELITVTRQ